MKQLLLALSMGLLFVFPPYMIADSSFKAMTMKCCTCNPCTCNPCKCCDSNSSCSCK